jgi:hypothetical protein
MMDLVRKVQVAQSWLVSIKSASVMDKPASVMIKPASVMIKPAVS